MTNNYKEVGVEVGDLVYWVTGTGWRRYCVVTRVDDNYRSIYGLWSNTIIGALSRYELKYHKAGGMLSRYPITIVKKVESPNAFTDKEYEDIFI